MINEAILAFVALVWLLTGRGLNLCFVIMAYYAMYIAGAILPFELVYSVSTAEALTTYAAQLSFDTIALVCVVALSLLYQEFIKIYVWYGAIIATSAILNSLMLMQVATDVYSIEHIHEFRQILSVPLDVAFAVLGSGKGGQNYIHINRSLLGACRSVYNRLNRISNVLKGAKA